MMGWYVVHTLPRAEARALCHLQNQGFRCFLPQLRTLRRHARKIEPVMAPFFPRYLFVEFDATAVRWRCINGTRGVVGLLTDGTNPLPVRHSVVESLRQQSDDTGAVSLSALGLFTQGVKVRITAGALAGQVGRLGKLSAHDRVVVLLDFMGAQASVQMPAYGIEAA
jgi:transcriptional antiterminator RfaH